MRRVALLIALVLTLAACGGSDDASGTTSDTGPAPGPDGETTTIAVRSGDNPIEGIATSGDLVETHYTGTLDDGSQFDSSVDRGPLSFTVDDGRMIKGFNDAVIGMAVNETKTITIPPEEAYGPYQEDAVIEVALTDLPEDVVVGDELVSPTGSVVVVIAVDDEFATIDTNHPLAGQNLTFEITLVSIER